MAIGITLRRFAVLFFTIQTLKTAKGLIVATVKENAAVGSTLSTSLAAPNSGYGYKLFDAGNHKAAQLFGVSPDGKITVKKKLNYVNGGKNTYELIVVKRKLGSNVDGSPEVVRVTIEDVNDHDPVFRKTVYDGYISEGAAVGSSVLGLKDCFATDEDSSSVSSYQIVGGNNDNIFVAKVKDVAGLKLLVIETTRTIDREALGATPNVKLQVQAVDGGNPARRSAQTEIRIQVLDKNDNNPVFKKTNWAVTIQENFPVMTSVLKVVATDNDEGSNQQLYYYFPDTQNDFIIDPYTGVIYVAAALSHPKKSNYKIKVIVTDRAVDNPRSSTCTVEISLVKVPGYPTATADNTAPMFSPPTYDIKVRDDMPIGAFVLLPRAIDKDGTGNNNGKLSFSMVSKSSDNPFAINPTSGAITVEKKLTPNKKAIEFSVKVEDGGTLQATASIKILIRAIAKNNGPPKFTQSTINVDLFDDASSTATVFTADAKDEDGVRYAIVGGTGLGRFKINEVTGVVNPKVLKRSIGTYDLYVEAKDQNQFQQSALMYARVNIKAHSANPVFSQAMYEASVTEHEPVGTFVTAVHASFPDETKVIQYKLEGDANEFKIDADTGVITTRVGLDYELITERRLSVKATVDGRTADAVLLIHIKNKNDEKPSFPNPNIQLRVPENLGYIPSLVCLFAKDGDGSDGLKYSIKSGNTDNLFKIDPNTGQLSAQNLDYEKRRSYTLQVEAVDGINTASATVNIEVSDDGASPEPPHFAPYNEVVSVTEGSPSATIADLSVTAATSGSFTCEFGFDVTPDILEHFKVTTRISSCAIETQKSLKWSKETPFYKFTVRAINKANVRQWSSAYLVVNIDDTNDHAPEFMQESYAISVYSTAEVGSSVLQVKATDKDDKKNGQVSYNLIVNADSPSFTVDPFTGLIKVGSALQSGKEYKLTVRASDNGAGSKNKDIQVVVGVHPDGTLLPVFVTPSSADDKVAEGTSTGDVMTVKAEVQDGTVQYSIVGGNIDNAFDIDSSGKIKVKGLLDYEKVSEYKLVVRASKSGVSPALVQESTVTIQIKDINDNAPVFNVRGNFVEVTIQTNADARLVTSMYRAFDKDSGNNGKLEYTLSSLAAMPFIADAQTGIVTTTQKILAPTTYSIVLKAQDKGSTPKSAELRIRVNVVAESKTPPTFQDRNYKGTLQDNTRSGRKIGEVTIQNDPQKFMQYQILAGNVDGSFCVDYTKAAYAQKPIDFDKWRQSTFEMTIALMYDNSISATEMWATIPSENDNAPVFVGGSKPVVKVLPENAAKGTFVHQFSAYDLDQVGGIVYSIQSYGNENSVDMFAIDSVNGKVTLAKSLDYEVLDKHLLTIKATETDSYKRYAYKDLIVKVIDVNDEAPLFSVSSSRYSIAKDALKGERVAQVVASDLDSGTNGEIKYSLTNDNMNLFKIDPATGVITLRDTISLVRQDSHTITVTATDKGTPSKTGQAVVIVETIIKDGAPKFALQEFKFNVKENTRMTGQTKAISVDTLTYTILAGNVDNRFNIDRTSGYISSAAKLDAEQGTKYTLIIEARDTSDRTSTAHVLINVENLNDNDPMFKNAKDGLIEKVVSNKVTAGEVMLTVEGYDLDVDDALTYEITDKAQKDNFEIGPKDGIIKLKKDWSKIGSANNFVEFGVKASDRGTPQKSKTVNVRIVFANFKPDHMKITKPVPEDSTVSSTAVITDLPRIFPRGGYQIIYPKKHPFKISEKTGDITLSEELDFEKVQKYDIVVQENNYNKEEKTRYVNYEVEVKVVDVNDNAPDFEMKSFAAKVNKNARPGTQVIKLLAKDADSGDAGRLSFEIITPNVPFNVNPVTHYVEVSKRNALTKNQYVIDVKAVDGGVPQKSSDQIRLTIDVVNDPPKFEEMLYKFKVSENAPVEKIVGAVKARSLSGIDVTYAIDSGNTNDKFRVDKSGNIIVQRPLDFETDANAFSLVVSAQEIAVVPLKATANVIIELVDVNDNAPRFSKIVYRSAPIPEDSPVNSQILTVSATDKDCGKTGVCVPGRLIYTINEFKDTFKINAITGEIKNIKPLDFETKRDYVFDVQVQDSGIKKLTAKARVIINVKNVNDNAPVFNPNSQTIYIDDSVLKGTTVTLVQASDADNDLLTYSMTGDSDAFVVNSKTGLVTVNTDRLQQTKYSYKISASDGKSMGEFALEINIEDKNDKAPKFEGCNKFKAVVEENKPAGQFVVQATATDDDSSGRSKLIEYTLLQITASKETVDQPVAGSGTTRTKDFTIDKTGTIRTNTLFDREAESHYTIIVIARDGGPNRTDAERNSAACQITVNVTDENDNKPVFAIEYFETSVSESQAVGSVVLITTAIDKDEGTNAKLVYSMDSHPLFEVRDSIKGEISVKAPLTGKSGTYQFLVKASDSGNPKLSTSVNVKITVGANTPPKFNSPTYTAKIKEEEGAGFAALTVKADSVSGAKVVYSLPKGTLEETNKDMFAIDSTTGVIKVAGELDYETIKNYIVYVQAKDEVNGMISNAIVYIEILDVNDNLPLFILRRFEYLTVTEGKPPGVVGRVFASDKDSTTNAEVRYSMGKSSKPINFAVDSITGELRSTTTFDRETTSQELFSVVVTDIGKANFHSDVSVFVQIIDINDNAPKLQPSVYSGSVKENVKIGYQVLAIQAKDLDAGDNAKVQFYITGGNEKGYFTTSKSTFEKGISTAYILVAKPLDRETDDTFKLRITATDSKYADTGEVNIKVLDANDNPPVFLKDFYTGSIKEDAKAGAVVTTVKAEDKDSAAVQGPIKYSLGADADGMFVINADTGVITAGSKPFDRETKPLYRFTAIASDGVHQSTVVVECTITDVNDEKPYFPGAPYTRYVEEHKPAGTVVGYIPAKDDDDPNAGGNAKIKYTIVGPAQGFAIDINTGLMTTLKEFDRESTVHSPIYKVRVKASDSGVPVQENETVVTIVVTDANDNDPMFTKKSFSGKVRECAPAGTMITTVTAVDKDDKNTVNAQLLYYVVSSRDNSEKYFHVDGATGVVTVAHGLDYEKSATYKLVVGVKDRGVPQRPTGREETASVDIIVTDCNDNRPMFIPDSYSVKVKENVKVGSTILTVTAVDKDKGSNGEFTFGIVDDETNFQFGIKSAADNKTKGIIRLLYPVDREAVAHHVFRVSASDMGIPKQTGYATVNISLVDVNDNGPHFDKPDYCGRVEEEVSGVQVVATIKVTDPDSSQYSCPCKFSFESGDTSLFEMRPAGANTIEVITKSSAVFDREKKQLYILKIGAIDRGNPPMKNVTTLKVDVHDKNDNEPASGGDLSLLVNSYKGQFLGGVIGKVYIKDNDKGSHDQYSHTLTSQKPGNYFSVNKATGEIVVAQNVPDGVYKLAFRSREVNRKVGPNLGKEVVSTATVTVRAISEKQAKTSVALRMVGLTKPLTCNEMAYPDFEAILAKILGVPKESVTVFSAQPVKDMHRGVDIRFAVKKSTKAGYAGDDAEYVDKSTLVPILNAKKKEIEDATKGKVASVGIDPCAKETCQVGFCYNDIQPQRSFGIVTDDNGIVPAKPSSQTFISIDVHVVATCLAEPRKPKSCKDKPCLFGGKCKDLVSGGYSCSCPNKKNYDGPECQYTTKSFKTKDSYLWVKPFNYFFEGTLSFEFGTKEANGIILYQGPVSTIKSTETKDFLAVELVDGRLRITVNQGDTFRNFVSSINTKDKLNNGVFHKVTIYKREKFIRVTVDECRDAEIVETADSTTQDRKSCEITGIIKGPYKFINGLNPLQLGGIKNKNLAYPPLTVKDSFSGCIRKVTDNGIVYDLSKPIEEKDVGLGCPLANACPNCVFGYCKMDQRPFVCVCQFGWTGDNCDRRVNSYHYLADSYTEYTFPKRTALSWKQKYHSLYQVQLQTKTNGIVLYEASPTSTGSPTEFSILEIANNHLQYRYNVGGGTKVLILRGANASDYKWHNVTVERIGNFATLTMHGVGQVSGTIGTHMLLDSDGVIYTGGVPARFNAKPPYDMRGCLGDCRVRNIYLDSDIAVERKRVNVKENGCPCVGIVCLNGGICVAGSPPYCKCPIGFTGYNCGTPIGPETGALAVVTKDGYMVMAVLLVVFLLALVLVALLLAGKLGRKKKVPVYLDDEPRDNIMPYYDEGAGEDDFHNYDLEKLLKHAGSGRGVGLANGAAGAKDIEHEPLISREEVAGVQAAVSMRQKKTRIEGANVESVDVARFITSRLAEANSEDAAYPRDTLLHYGYEGEGSDVDDLSELGDSEDESDDDDADFGFLGDWGAKFDNLNKIYNPPTQEFDEDV